MKKIVLHIAQGTFICVDIGKYQGEDSILTLNQIIKENKTQEPIQEKNSGSTSEELLIAAFTDNLLPCSCFFIKDKDNHFFIMSHVDSITNIFDPDCGLFAVLEDKIKEYHLKAEDIKIYFEIGATESSRENPIDYLKLVELYLKDKNKKYKLYFIEKDEKSEQFEIVERVDDLTKGQEECFLLKFNNSHEFDSIRRDAVCYLNSNGLEFDFGFNGNRQACNESDILSIVMKNRKKFNFELIDQKPTYFEARRFTGCNDEEELVTQYKKMIAAAIIEELYPDTGSEIRSKGNLENRKTKMNSTIMKLLDEEEIYLFPPICIYQGKNIGKLGSFEMEMKVYQREAVSKEKTSDSIQVKMEKYLKTIEKILSEMKDEKKFNNLLSAAENEKDRKSEARKLLLNLKIDFFQTYNKISKSNNYFLRQNKEVDIATPAISNDDLLEQNDLFELLEILELTNKNFGVGNTKNEFGLQKEGHFVTYYEDVEVMDSLKDSRQVVKQCCGLHAVEGALIVEEIVNLFKEEHGIEPEVQELQEILDNTEIKQMYKDQKSEETDLLSIRSMLLELKNDFEIVRIRDKFSEIKEAIAKKDKSVKDCTKLVAFNKDFIEIIKDLNKEISQLKEEEQRLIDKLNEKVNVQTRIKEYFKKMSKAYQKVLDQKEKIKKIIKERVENRGNVIREGEDARTPQGTVAK